MVASKRLRPLLPNLIPEVLPAVFTEPHTDDDGIYHSAVPIPAHAAVAFLAELASPRFQRSPNAAHIFLLAEHQRVFGMLPEPRTPWAIIRSRIAYRLQQAGYEATGLVPPQSHKLNYESLVAHWDNDFMRCASGTASLGQYRILTEGGVPMSTITKVARVAKVAAKLAKPIAVKGSAAVKRVASNNHPSSEAAKADNVALPPSKPPRKASPEAATKAKKRPSGLDAAFHVLAQAGVALPFSTLFERIVEQKLWAPKGKTPAATLSAALYMEMKRHGAKSRFTRTSDGKYDRRK